MALHFKSTWYKPPSLTVFYDANKLKELAGLYHDWYTKQHGKRFRIEGQQIQNLEVRKTILYATKIVGYIDKRPVTIRHVTQSNQFSYPNPASIHAKPGQVCKSEGVTAPALYLVAFGGKRLDSFLSGKVAKEFALSFIKLNSGTLCK